GERTALNFVQTLSGVASKVRHYVALYKDRLTLAYRIGTQNTIAGESPFYMNTYHNTLFIQRVLYEGLGGANSLRGVMRNRILARGFAFANVELRTKIFTFDIGKQHFYIGLNPFADLGMVTQAYNLDEDEIRNAITLNNIAQGRNDKFEDYFDTSKNAIYRPHISAGLGLKIAMNENFVLSVDWAAAIDKQDNGKMTNFYIKMGYLF
ncbi:MAG: BamA/TamA family outer membrane protein, partial [Bacteroidales bacterium]|nr:BamA/TamA family outer membrane protein [Bacteroidales bacterium]